MNYEVLNPICSRCGKEIEKVDDTAITREEVWHKSTCDKLPKFFASHVREAHRLNREFGTPLPEWAKKGGK